MIVAKPPEDQTFSFIYNGKTFFISKFEFGLASKKFYSLENFFQVDKYIYSGEYSFETLETFLCYAQMLEFPQFHQEIKSQFENIFSSSNIIEFIKLAQEWETIKVEGKCLEYLKSDFCPLELIVNALLNSTLKDSSILETAIASRFDDFLKPDNISLLLQISLDNFTRIIHNSSFSFSNHRAYLDFLNQIIKIHGENCSFLFNYLDLRLIPNSELSSFFSNSIFKNIHSQLSSDLNIENNKNNDINDDIDSLMESLTSRINSLQQNQFDLSLRIQAKRKQQETIDKYDLESDFNQILENKFIDVEKHAQKDLKKTNSTVKGLTKKVSSLESFMELEKQGTMRLEFGLNAITKILDSYLDVSEEEDNEEENGEEQTHLNAYNEEENETDIEISFEGHLFNGILNHLAEASDQKVLETSVVTISISSNGKSQNGDSDDKQESLQNVCDFTWDGYIQTEDKEHSWILYDFLNKKISVSKYVIKTANLEKNGPHLKGWNIEGSNDGEAWTLIDNRSAFESLNGPKLYHLFDVNGEGEEQFKLIRLIQIEPNYQENNILSLSNIEFFGVIFIP